MNTASNIITLKSLFHLSYDSLDARTQRLFKYLIANPNHTNVDTIFQLHHLPWYDQSPLGLLMRCLKIGRKEWMSEDALQPIFSGRKSYDKALRKLLQLGLVEKWENDSTQIDRTWISRNAFFFPPSTSRR
jgi:hypothetical protein